MLKQRGFLGIPIPSGVTLYVALACLAVVAGLSAAVAYYRNDAKRAEAEATLARSQRDQLKQDLAESEETIEALRVAARVLDEQLTKINRRESELLLEKRRLKEELDALAKTLPPEDQACLARPLPDAIAERLLNERASNKDKGGEAARSRSPIGPVR